MRSKRQWTFLALIQRSLPSCAIDSIQKTMLSKEKHTAAAAAAAAAAPAAAAPAAATVLARAAAPEHRQRTHHPQGGGSTHHLQGGCRKQRKPTNIHQSSQNKPKTNANQSHQPAKCEMQPNKRNKSILTSTRARLT